jgi:hypothetical protein
MAERVRQVDEQLDAPGMQIGPLPLSPATDVEVDDVFPRML